MKSGIKTSVCQVEFCENPVWAKKFCKYHQHHRTDRAPKPLKKTMGKRKYEDLRPFFTAAMSQCSGYCRECGAKIPEFQRQWSIAHVLPKAKFASVAAHPFNWIELCPTCHDKYDTGPQTASQMKVWPLAKARFTLFEKMIDPDELKHVPEQFYHEI